VSFWQDIYTRIAANDTEAIAWYKDRNQAIGRAKVTKNAR
jgi:hypothetical protein